MRRARRRLHNHQWRGQPGRDRRRHEVVATTQLAVEKTEMIRAGRPRAQTVLSDAPPVAEGIDSVPRALPDAPAISGLLNLWVGLQTLATPPLIVSAPWVTPFGIIVGSLTGLTATMGVALVTTLTYSLDPTHAIFVLMCMYVGAIYGGGARSAILLKIPGTSASAAMWNRAGELTTKKDKSDLTLPDLIDLWCYPWTIARSGIIGTLVWIIPGVSEDIGAWASCAALLTSEAAKFGSCSHEGHVAAKTGGNAVVPSSPIPAITLALPGSASAAVLIAAFVIHGIHRGPLHMIEQPEFIGLVSAMVPITTLFMAAYGLTQTRPFLLVLRQMKYPMAPLMLGIILGTPLDKSLLRGLALSDGHLEPFFTRPVSALFVVITILPILLNIGPVRRAHPTHTEAVRCLTTRCTTNSSPPTGGRLKSKRGSRANSATWAWSSHPAPCTLGEAPHHLTEDQAAGIRAEIEGAGLRGLIDLCASLGGDVLIPSSPKRRV
ncbi:MAG: tripartite tricarboxylate transporter permease [Shimia sp.]